MSKKKNRASGIEAAETESSIFNPAQLCTIEEARDIAAMIHFDGGVAPEVPSADANKDDDYHNTVSGIYLDPWANPTGDTPEPRIGDARPFKFKFNPTADGFQPGGFNVGLIRQTAIGHAPPADDGQPANPPNWDFALESLKSEVDAQIAAFDAQK